MAFCSCSLEKKVIVTTRGYEPYRQTGMSDAQIKGLHIFQNKFYAALLEQKGLDITTIRCTVIPI